MTEVSLNSPAGQEWIPWFRRFFEEGLDETPERSAKLVLDLASGAFGELAGLYLTIFDDLPAIAAAIERVRKEQLHTMRVRVLAVNPSLAAVSSIREAGERGKG